MDEWVLKGKCIWAATLAVVTWLVIVIFQATSSLFSGYVIVNFKPRHHYFQATSSLFSGYVIVLSGHVIIIFLPRHRYFRPRHRFFRPRHRYP